jgi:hypothetical protein
LHVRVNVSAVLAQWFQRGLTAPGQHAILLRRAVPMRSLPVPVTRLLSPLTVLLWLIAVAPAFGQTPSPPRASTATAEELMPTAYVQGGLVVSVHPAGPGYLRVDSTVHGATAGAMLAGGVRLGPTVALEAEAMLERGLSAPLAFTSGGRVSRFEGELRDLWLGANLRWNPGRKYHLELVAGGGMAVSRYAQRGVSSEGAETFRQPMFGAGIAFPMRLTPRVAVVPTAGYRWVKRPGVNSAAALGASRHVFHAGVVIRRQTSGS